MIEPPEIMDLAVCKRISIVNNIEQTRFKPKILLDYAIHNGYVDLIKGGRREDRHILFKKISSLHKIYSR